MEKLFGTDGIRGVAGRHPVTPETAAKLGSTVVRWCMGLGRSPVIIVGRDTRISGPELEDALVSGITSAGGAVLRAGVFTTPAVAYLTHAEHAGAGVAISASHNPHAYNGFKLFSGAGYKLSEREESEIEVLMAVPGKEAHAPGFSRDMPIDDAKERYLRFLGGSVPAGISFADLRIALDCANGAASGIGPRLFGDRCGSVDVLSASPDGTNINQGCGSEHTGPLQERVVAAGAHAGLAFDGDGDRLIAVDEAGRVLTGDQVIAVCAAMLKRKGELRNDLVVTTVMSNVGLKHALRGLGISHIETQVGDRSVMEAMKASGAVLGGEASGHIIFSAHHTTGDGLLSGLMLLSAIKYFDRPLSQLAKAMTLFPQTLINVPVSRKPDISGLPEVLSAVRDAEGELGDKGRVLVRYSGTEPLCRVMVEGEDKGRVVVLARGIADAVASSLS
jgi:phosphoglucosamine mutase